MNSDADLRWRASATDVERTIRAYFRGQGRDPGGATVDSTVATNTELVPRRADNLQRALTELTDLPSVRGLDVVEVGCGFGALAGYMAISWELQSIRAVDIRPDFAASARELARRLGVEDSLSVAEDDMRTLETIPRATADLIVANNAFIYLRAPGAMAEAADAFARVLRPGGHVLLFHANKHLRDPFTKDPIVHLLPPVLGKPIGRVTGWKSSRDRVRLLWPWQLRRLLGQAGFERFQAGGFRGAEFDTGLSGRRANFYAAAARRPASGESSSSP
jgi:SAM-dependent methyltransferase